MRFFKHKLGNIPLPNGEVANSMKNKKAAILENKKANKKVIKLFEENHFTIKIHLATGGK